MFNSKTWHIGEKYASDYLKSIGYKILLTNDKLSGAEVDIVALLPKKQILKNLKEEYKSNKLQKNAFDAASKQAQDVIVFVEVKARNSYAYGLPQEAVNGQKQMHIKRYAKTFLSKNNLQYAEVRFDVIAIVVGDNYQNSQIEHIKDAF